MRWAARSCSRLYLRRSLAGGREPSERGDLCERAARCAPSRQRPWQRASAGGRRRATAAAPWLTRWSRVARESTVRLASRSRVPQAHWLGGPATLVGRRGPPWPARVARPGQYAWGRRASLVRATQPPWLGDSSRTGWSARARLGGGQPGWLATYGRWPHTYTLFLYMTAGLKRSLTTLIIPKSPPRPFRCFPGLSARQWVRTVRSGGQGHQDRRSAAVLTSCAASLGTGGTPRPAHGARHELLRATTLQPSSAA